MTRPYSPIKPETDTNLFMRLSISTYRLYRDIAQLFAATCRPLAWLLPALWLAACSTTKNLPEEETLYVGIQEITYSDAPNTKKDKAKNDSTGVITSIGNAVVAVDRVLSGQATPADAEAMLKKQPDELTKEERKALKQAEDAEKQDFATAQSEVEAVLAYAPNNSLFGSSYYRTPLPTGLWLYNGFVNSQSKVGKWIFKTFAGTPVYISTVSPEMRARVATNTLHNYGYFRGRVDYEILPRKNPRKAKVSYHVVAGPLSRLDSIAYLNFPPVADSLLRANSRASYLKSGDAFSVVNLANEQTRLEQLFRENGYFYYSAEYTTYLADTLQRPGRVQLRVQPDDNRPARVRHPWYIGNTYITVRNNETETVDKTLRRRNYTYAYGGDKLPLRPNVWRSAITHRKGELYRLSQQNTTLEKLGALGIFSQMDVSYVPRDTSALCDTLDIYVTTMMDKLYDSSFEMNATFKSNQQVGPGINFGLAKRNAFRGGEKVSFNVFGSYEWQTGMGSQSGNSLLNSYEIGTELAFEFPRFVFPGISRRRLRFPASTTFALTADWKNRSGFFNMVSMGGNATYKWHKRASQQHELTLLSLDFDKMLSTTTQFDSIMTANPALYVSMRDQFIPSLSYTYTYVSSARHRNPVWLQFSVKEAGNVTSAIYAACGESFDKQDKKLFGNPFAQFVKFTAEFHETVRIPRSKLKVAGRFFAGIIYSYGNSLRAPYADQFYVGGANSVRGFTVRTIGPGSYKSYDSKYAYIDQTGDFKLEANLELRAPLFGSLHGAVFLDAGNVWLLRSDPARPGSTLSAENLKKIAVGTGLGLRYDLEFLVLRFDVGVALHAPYDTGKGGWYNIPKFGKGLAYHFAIGYPF